MEGKSKALAYRIDKETEKNLEKAFTKRDIDFVKETLFTIEANYKSVNILKKLTKVLDRREKINWGTEMIKIDNPIHQVMGAYLLDQTRYFQIDHEFIMETVIAFCHHENWNIRQAGIDLMERMVIMNENHEIPAMKRFIHSEDPFLRRLALLTSKSIASSANYDKQLKSDLLHILESSLNEQDPYVQTISHETFQDGYMKYCPDMTLTWLEDKISNTDNILVKSTILAILGTRYVDSNIDQVLTIIGDVLTDDDEEIKKARSSALHILSQKHHDEVSAFLEERLHISQALDHWAELEADGTLNSFDF